MEKTGDQVAERKKQIQNKDTSAAEKELAGKEATKKAKEFVKEGTAEWRE